MIAVVDSARSVAVLATVALALALAGAVAAGHVAAQPDDETDGPPPVPPSFHGNAIAGGEPAPEGTEVVALVGGEERGSATVGPNGSYGGSGLFEEKLVVRGTEADAGETVGFEVDGVATDQTANWSAGTTRRLDLTVDDLGGADSDGDGLPIGGGPGRDDDGTPGQSVGEDGGENGDGPENESANGPGGGDDGRPGDGDRGNESDDGSNPGGEGPGGPGADAPDDGELPGFGVGPSIAAIVGLLLGRRWRRRSRGR